MTVQYKSRDAADSDYIPQKPYAVGEYTVRVTVAADISAPEAIALAKAEPNVEKELAGKTVVKEIYVPGKLVNLAAK